MGTALIVSKTITPSSSEHQGERKVVYSPKFSLIRSANHQ